MAWALILLLIGFSILFLIFFGKMPRRVWEWGVAILFLGAAGYFWQGNWDLPGMPRQHILATDETDIENVIEQRVNMDRRFSSAKQWTIVADGLNRRGRHKTAAEFLLSGVRHHPNDADLWVAYGNSLTILAEGVITPAAKFAFTEAAKLSPNHPAPVFFTGLEKLQMGDAVEARSIWTSLLEKSRPGSPWRKDVEERLAALDQAVGEVRELSEEDKATMLDLQRQLEERARAEPEKKSQ